MKELSVSVQEIYMKCQETINSFLKKKKTAETFKRTDLFVRLVFFNGICYGVLNVFSLFYCLLIVTARSLLKFIVIPLI